MTATPETVKAAFTKENDVFAEHNVKYIDPVLNFADQKLFAFQMLQAWQPIMGLSQEENDRASRIRIRRADGIRNQHPARARVRFSISWSAKTASASSCSAVPIITIPA